MLRRKSTQKCDDDSYSQLRPGSQYNQTENPLYQEHKPQKKIIKEASSQPPEHQQLPRESSR